MPEASLLYGLAYAAHWINRGTRLTAANGSPVANDDRVLHLATCKLYTGLFDTCGRGL